MQADGLPYRLVSRRPMIIMPASKKTVKRKHADLDVLQARLARADSDLQGEPNDRQHSAVADGDIPSSNTTATVNITPMLSLFIHTPSIQTHQARVQGFQ